ncbi:MAG TPA: DNA gyrase subunit A [Saccharofermentans sp.]|nr:DNA gyrase subunit A [Clostridia bacterium]NLX68407.1 DNA gyrase subunit A [Clostridiaceae bacterium]HUM23970.1 DNA gyrase subunit A [Saccharofermentans sp.]
MADNSDEIKNLRKQQEAETDLVFKSEQNTIIPIDLEREMKKSFIDYAMSVISDRALPDVRDGLKPVHRRILYSMYTQGFTPDKAYRKCATTIGDVLGRFHPHGDASVYDALVRLAQDFSLRHPLVDGHGNFGSIDGDPPAAYRYTEARLEKVALEMMSDIKKNTVDFRPNFDEHEMEPIALPSRFPNLLVNGSVGIAVGMATNIPPHNMGEVIDGVVLMLDNPEVTLEELLNVIKGPDFPTGGAILGQMGIRETYKTGRGRIVVRAHAEIEDMQGGRQRIVIHDLPFAVNKARLIERMADLVKDKRVEGISGLRDESDRNEMVRIVIELKKDANADVVLNQLYKNCALQDACCANMLALVPDKDGKLEPKTVTLIDCLKYYIEHQENVVTRRTIFDKENAEAKRHIDEGLLIAIDNIDEVIQIIRSQRTEQDAKVKLCERFGFSDKQAQHIVDMRLGRLTGLERDNLEAEIADLNERIAHYERILSNSVLLRSTIKSEILEIKRKFATPRVTEIVNGAFEDIDDESLIQEQDIIVTLTHFGYIKRQPIDVYKSQHRGGRGIAAQSTREEDYVEKIITTSTHDYLLCFTNTGRVFKIKGYSIPETTSRTARGTAIVNLLNLGEGEKIRNVIPIKSFEDDMNLVVATKSGIVKKTPISSYTNINKNGLIAVSIRENDEVTDVALVAPNQEIILVSASGKSIRFQADEVRSTGRNTSGVKGMTLSEDDKVVGMVPVDNDDELFIITEKGFGKRSKLDEYRVQGRGGKGLITYRVTEKTGRIAGCALINSNCDLLVISDSGVMIRISASEIPVLSRATSGVTLMRAGGNFVADFALTDHIEEDEADVENEPENASTSEVQEEQEDN